MTRDTRALAFGVAAVACWSTVATAFKISLLYLSPIQLVLYASLSSTVFLLVAVSVRKEWQLMRELRIRDWAGSALFGALNPFLYYWVLFNAYDLLPAQQAQAINYSWALTMTLLSVPLLKHHFGFRDAAAAVICYAGVVVVATRGQWLGGQELPLLGIGLALLSTFLWALYWILNARDGRPPVAGLLCNFVCALPMLVALCLWQGESLVVAWQGLAGAVYVGLFEMGLAFVLWLTAMKQTSKTARIANLIYLSPLVSLFLISTVLGEVILPATLIGMAMIIAGLIIQQSGKSEQKIPTLEKGL